MKKHYKEKWMMMIGMNNKLRNVDLKLFMKKNKMKNKIKKKE
jgi:hypothetical protein